MPSNFKSTRSQKNGEQNIFPVTIKIDRSLLVQFLQKHKPQRQCKQLLLDLEIIVAAFLLVEICRKPFPDRKSSLKHSCESHICLGKIMGHLTSPHLVHSLNRTLGSQEWHESKEALGL